MRRASISPCCMLVPYTYSLTLRWGRSAELISRAMSLKPMMCSESRGYWLRISESSASATFLAA